MVKNRKCHASVDMTYKRLTVEHTARGETPGIALRLLTF